MCDLVTRSLTPREAAGADKTGEEEEEVHSSQLSGTDSVKAKDCSSLVSEEELQFST